jgi:hypothetical protein
MTFRNFAAAGLALLAPVIAAAQAPLPVLRIDPTAGGSVFYIKNTYTQPVTAYFIEMADYPGSYYSLWADISDSEPIAPAAEIRKPISNMTVGAVPDYVKLQAAIFADGSTAGVPEKITLLLGRRRAILSAVRDMVRIAEKTAAKETLIQDLKQYSESLPTVSRAQSRSQAGVDQSAVRATVAKAMSRLGAESPELLLAELRLLERMLTASKPAL